MLKYLINSAPTYLIFYVTGRCNANCIHCFNWALKPNDLTLDEIRKIAKKWGRLAIVNLGGGEPYLRHDLPHIVEAFDSKIIAIPSNGIQTEHIVYTIDKLLNMFPKRFFRFTFSIDGIGKEHDAIRGVNCFDKVSKTIKEVSKLKKIYKNFSLMTNSCFIHQNQNTLLDTIKYIRRNFDIDFSSVTYVRGNARFSFTKQELFNDKYKEISKYLNRINYSKFKNHPMSWFIRNVTLRTRKKVLENLETGKRNFECYATKRMIVVDNTGEVRVCEPLTTLLGNLKDYDYDIKKLLANSACLTVREMIKHHLCNCTWECAIRTGLIYNPKEWIANITYMFTKR